MRLPPLLLPHVRRFRIRTLLAAVGLSISVASGSGCQREPVRVLEPGVDEGAGRRGRFGVERFDRTFRVRVDETVTSDVFVPITEQGLVPENMPIALVVQGGLVPIERYRWIAEHLASRGFIAVMPRHPFDLAIFSTPNGLGVVEALRRAGNDPTDPLFGRIGDDGGLAIGHSLGGVIAAKAWLFGPEYITHLALLASFADPADNAAIATRRGGKVVSVIGTADGPIDEIAEGATVFGSRVTAAAVEGMNHYQFTDDATEDELAKDGVSTTPLEVARERAIYLVDHLVADLVDVRGSDASVLARPSGWPEGLVPLDEDVADEIIAARGTP